MANFSIKLDLSKLQGAFVTNLKGNKDTKVCLCIPVEEAKLFLGKQGCYLDLTAVALREPKYDDTHCIKQQFSKEVYQSMTEEQRSATPILGGLHELQRRQPEQQEVKTTATADPNDDLPF